MFFVLGKINSFWLGRGRVLPLPSLPQLPWLCAWLVGLLLKTKFQNIFIKTKIDKACFQHDIAYGDLKIYLEEQLQAKYYVIKHLILQKIQNLMGINVYLV